MKYLLDTHVILWWLLDPKELNKKARDIISDRSHLLFTSSVSFWEMAIKSSIGRLNLPNNMIELLKNEKIDTLPLTAEDALSVVDLPILHNDPFDRMLVVQAKRHDMVLITRDSKLGQYPVTILKA